MILYLTLFLEFFKIGLLAIGGGLVTIPFLFQLTEKYDWFSVQQLTNMIAVGESTPGPIGVNVATFAGFSAAGYWGGIIATTGLVMPSLLIIMLVSKILQKYKDNPYLQSLLSCLRPAVLALVLVAGYGIAELALINAETVVMGVAFALLIRFVKASPILYLLAGGVLGVFLRL